MCSLAGQNVSNKTAREHARIYCNRDHGKGIDRLVRWLGEKVAYRGVIKDSDPPLDRDVINKAYKTWDKVSKDVENLKKRKKKEENVTQEQEDEVYDNYVDAMNNYSFGK